MKLPIIFIIVGLCWATVTFGKSPCGRAKRAIDDSSDESESSENECNFPSISDAWSRRFSQLSSQKSVQPWWNGPNVCLHEENVEEAATNFPSWSSYHSESCRDTERSRRCTRETLQNSTLVKHVTIHECCPGFARRYGDVGCPQSFELKSLQDTLAEMNLTMFSEAARQAKLFDQITDDGNYTIFAPTNEAFEKSPADGEFSFVTLNNNDHMQFPREILASHVVARRLDYDSLKSEENIPSLKEGAVIRPVFYAGIMPFSQISTINCVRLVKADRQTKNGLVHVIDHVMPEATRSLYQILKDDSRFSTFLSLTNEEMLRSLDDSKVRYTVFAFTDEGFGKLSAEAQERIKNRVSCTSDLIRNHIVGSTMCSSSLVLLRNLKTTNGRLLHFKYNETTSIDDRTPILVNGQKLISKDEVATNGVLHVVEEPILFTNNIEALEVLSLLGYEDLARAMKIGPISDALSNANFTTLFVPPKEVVQQILETNDTHAKKNLLTNLVVDPSFVGHSTIKTLSNNKYSLSGPYRRLMGCRANIVYDVFTCNGIVRFLDNTLPNVSGGNIMEILRNDPDLSRFSDLVAAADMNDSVFANESISLTLLAPSNDALKNFLTEEQYESLLQNRESSRKFVSKHAFRGSVCCDQLTETTFSGGKLSSLRPYYRRMLGMRNPRIKRCNSLATNGIVHVIENSPNRQRGFFDSDFFDSLFDDTLFDLSL